MNDPKVIDLSVYIKQIKVPKLVKSYTTPDGITYIPSRADVSKKSVRCEVIINGFSIGDKNIIDENIVNHLILKDENNTNEVFDFSINKDAINKEFRYTSPLLYSTVWHSLIDNKIYVVVDGMLLKITGNASRDDGTLTEDELPNEEELFSKYNAKTVISELVSIAVNEIKNNNKGNCDMGESDVLERCKLVNIPLSQIHQHEIPTKDILTINPLTISTIKLNEYAKDTVYPLKTNQFIGLKFSKKNGLSETYMGDKVTFDIYHRQNVTGEFKPTSYEYKARIAPSVSSEETNSTTLSVYEITGIPVKSLTSKYSYSGEWNKRFISGNNIVFLSKHQSDPPRPFVIYGVSSPSGKATLVKLYDLIAHESFTVNSTMIHSPEFELYDLYNFIEWTFWYGNIIMLEEE